jgi:hypothetical protein
MEIKLSKSEYACGIRGMNKKQEQKSQIELYKMEAFSTGN